MPTLVEAGLEVLASKTLKTGRQPRRRILFVPARQDLKNGLQPDWTMETATPATVVS